MSGAAETSPAARFELDWTPLGDHQGSFGDVALIPWDTDIFGFGVADFRPGSVRDLISDPSRLSPTLEQWAEKNSVELVGCRIPSHPSAGRALLEDSGFRFIEAQLRATIPQLKRAALDRPRITVRQAVESDHARIVEIAGSSFDLGRYHADPRFPRKLADRRYRVWMERALAKPAPETWIGVVGPVGAPAGFLLAERSGDGADIRLAAIDRGAPSIAGPELFRGALCELAARGLDRVTARISASNSAVLNIYSSLGFRFHDPETVSHWHHPGSSRFSISASARDEEDGPDGQEPDR